MKQQNNKQIALKTLVYGALFTALAVVLGRATAVYPAPGMKYTLDKFVLFMAGMFFGPFWGGMIGFLADMLGGMLFGVGWFPQLCVPAVLYGVFGGIFRKFLLKKFTMPRLVLAYAFPIVIGSVLYQSVALAATYMPTTIMEGTITYLLSRSVQFAIMLVLEVVVIYVLIKTGIFTRTGLWQKEIVKKDMTITTPEEAVAYIHSVFWKGSIPGLGRTQTLLEKMGNPEKKLKFIHIAGTNGKGSTASMTASILRKAGYKVGLYTSPYIYRFNERMQINGQQIPDDELVDITAWVKPLADSMEESPTEFELVTSIAFEYFMRGGCDIVVLEVGMGGAWDSTNVIEAPEVAVITNIGLDHTDVLGSTVEEIAETKAGIFKEGSSAVIYRGSESVEAVFERVCAQKNIPLKKADFDSLVLRSHGLTGQVFDCGQRKELTLPLLGDHQLHNAAVVLGIADTLIEKGWNITEEHIREGLRDVSWPGRFDIVGHDPLFIIDGGHNPQCIEALVKNIEDYLADRKVIALTGVLADKDYGDMYKPVMPLVQEFVCITPPNPRKLDAGLLAQYLMDAGTTATAYETIEQGVIAAREKAGKDGVVLCFGSLYSIGSIKEALDEVTK